MAGVCLAATTLADDWPGPKKSCLLECPYVALAIPDFVSGHSSAVSSVVEHYLDTVGVTGSNPVSRTILKKPKLL